jgi:hypothetical protein
MKVAFAFWVENMYMYIFLSFNWQVLRFTMKGHSLYLYISPFYLNRKSVSNRKRENVRVYDIGVAKGLWV